MKVQAICDHASPDCPPCLFSIAHTHPLYELPYDFECDFKGGLHVACVLINPDNDLEDNDGKM